VVGHDWGASLAWYMAMKAPARLDKLVVLSVGHADEAVLCMLLLLAPG
jgi:pimeloyl-ACP methyl ester carboxylesterase